MIVCYNIIITSQGSHNSFKIADRSMNVRITLSKLVHPRDVMITLS